MAHKGQLILVRHSLPAIVPGIEAPEWRLGEEGRRRAEVLAEELRSYAPVLIATSPEPKARETAEIIASIVGAPIRETAGLAEHDRAGAAYRESGADFRRDVEAFFTERERPVFGRETAMRAYARFSRAIDQILSDTPEGNVVGVTHGRVTALFVSVRGGIDGFTLWKRLGTPSFIVLVPPDFEVVRIVEEAG